MKGNDKMPVYHFSYILRRPGGTNIAYFFLSSTASRTRHWIC